MGFLLCGVHCTKGQCEALILSHLLTTNVQEDEPQCRSYDNMIVSTNKTRNELNAKKL